MGSIKEYKMKNYALNVPEGGGSTSDATAAAVDIIRGKTAYIATGKVTGSLIAQTVPGGDGTDDTYSGTLALTTNSYTGVSTEILMKDYVWVTAIKAYIATSDSNATLNIRTADGAIKVQKTGVSLTGGQYNTITLDTPVFMAKDAYYFIEILFTSQKINRTSGFSYDGTLWKLLRSRTNSYTGTTFDGTMGLGLVEYNG